MGILEKITRNVDNRYWDPGVGAFPVKNRYTAGVAGQRFFEKIKEDGNIIGTRCEACEITYVPARLYCERCFKRLEEKDWVDVGTEGIIHSFTVVHKTLEGETKEKPTLLAAIQFADGMLIHRMGECKEEEVYIGMKVTAHFKAKPKRKGGINDIDYFKPL